MKWQYFEKFALILIYKEAFIKEEKEIKRFIL